MPITSPGNDDDTGENHQPTLRKNTAEPVEQTLKQNTRPSSSLQNWELESSPCCHRATSPVARSARGLQSKLSTLLFLTRATSSSKETSQYLG
ncbi:hypothetical protein DD721_06005 [Bifidobacterium longum]|nr:hypothetical protein DD678_02515 [Bifidobacterium longum]PVV49996.1 hypothetical protein DD701_00170 [Bifidobacterium longum]PVV58337.1 hypothetical protein DD721_06005 [Bifidobacterium longum]PVV62212.1 hypothetical protein DD705_00500 [Bifidobacterium longum]